MSIILVYQTAELVGYPWSGLPYFSISLSLNVLLTLMIVIRLILHTRSVRTAMGISGIGGLSNAIITMLIESCALYAVSSLLVLGPWSAVNSSVEIFLPILAETQVRIFSRLRFSDTSPTCDDALNRSSPHCSSFNESPTRARLRETASSPDV